MRIADTYIRAEESEKISAFDDMSLIQLIVERGPDAVDQLPKDIRNSEAAVAETIENNVRKLIINESPVDPAYYDKMSKLLDALIEQRRRGVVSYKAYLEKIAQLTKDATLPGSGPGGYPAGVRTAAQRALFNNLNGELELTLRMDAAIQTARMDDWRDNTLKTKKVRLAIKGVLEAAATVARPGLHGDYQIADSSGLEAAIDRILDLARHQRDY